MPRSPLSLPLSLLLCLVLLAALAGTATAAGTPSSTSCEGTVTVKCYICDTGKYLGEFTVPSKYNPATDSCFSENVKNTRYRCFVDHYKDYDDDWTRTGIKVEYWLGTKKYDEKHPDGCGF